FVCQVLTERVAALRQRADEHRGILARGTHRRTRGQRTEAVNLGCLSDSRRRRSNKGRAAEQRDEVAPPHSITSLARAISVGGTSRPSTFAVLRLMTNSNLVGCSIGNSEAFAPLRILTTNAAARRLRSGTFGP